MNEDLKGSSLADVLEKLEKGKIGHRAAMDWLNVKSYDDLVDGMSRSLLNFVGRALPGSEVTRPWISPQSEDAWRDGRSERRRRSADARTSAVRVAPERARSCAGFSGHSHSPSKRDRAIRNVSAR